MKVGVITCSYFMRIYGYKPPEGFTWGAMCDKWRAEFKKPDFLKLAQEIYDIGYHSLEIWEPTFSHKVYSLADAEALAKDLAGIGFESVAYCIGGWGAAGVPEVEPAYAFAKALGAKVVAGCITQPDADVILPVVEAAGKKYGIRYAIENHPKPNFESAVDIAKAVAKYETIGANLDVGIYNQQAYDLMKSMDMLKGKIYHVHFKDTLTGGEGCLPIGDGDAPVAAVYQRLAKENYGGMISVEIEFPTDPAPALTKSIRYINSIS